MLCELIELVILFCTTLCTFFISCKIAIEIGYVNGATNMFNQTEYDVMVKTILHIHFNINATSYLYCTYSGVVRKFFILQL